MRSGHGARVQYRRRLGQIVGEQSFFHTPIGRDGPKTLHVQGRLVDILPAAKQDPAVVQHSRVKFVDVVHRDAVDVSAVPVHHVQRVDARVETRYQCSRSRRSEDDPSVRQVGRRDVVMPSAGAVFLRRAGTVLVGVCQSAQSLSVDPDFIDTGVSVLSALEREQDPLCAPRQLGITIHTFAKRLVGRRIDNGANPVFLRRLPGILQNVDTTPGMPSDVVVVNMSGKIRMPFDKQHWGIQERFQAIRFAGLTGRRSCGLGGLAAERPCCRQQNGDQKHEEKENRTTNVESGLNKHRFLLSAGRLGAYSDDSASLDSDRFSHSTILGFNKSNPKRQRGNRKSPR